MIAIFPLFETGQPVAINSDYVVTMYNGDPGSTVLFMSNDNIKIVRSTLEDAVAKLNGIPLAPFTA